MKTNFKKLTSWLLTIAMVLTMLPTVAFAEGETTPNAGLDTNTNTYYVVGTDGYPTKYGQKIELPAGATLDLTYAENYVKGNSQYNYTGLFYPKGDLTIIGDGDEISFDGKSIIYGNLENYTLTLDNLNWTDSTSVSNGFATSSTTDVTIKYKGKCALPKFDGYYSNAKITFQPVDANSTLNMSNFRVIYGWQYPSAKVVFDGGTVTMREGIEFPAVEIKNNCNMTISGDDAYGIKLTSTGSFEPAASGLGTASKWGESSKIVITGSTLNITIGKNPKTSFGGYALGSGAPPQYNTRWYYGLFVEKKNESGIVIDNSTVNVDASNNLYFSGIGGVASIDIKNNSKVTAKVSDADSDSSGGTKYFYMSAIGGMFKSISITDSEVTANGGYAAGIGTGHAGFRKIQHTLAKPERCLPPPSALKTVR